MQLSLTCAGGSRPSHWSGGLTFNFPPGSEEMHGQRPTSTQWGCFNAVLFVFHELHVLPWGPQACQPCRARAATSASTHTRRRRSGKFGKMASYKWMHSGG